VEDCGGGAGMCCAAQGLAGGPRPLWGGMAATRHDSVTRIEIRSMQELNEDLEWAW
jgi:hypothetical protein